MLYDPSGARRKNHHILGRADDGHEVEDEG